MNIKEESLTVSGQEWKQFTFSNNNGMEVSCLNFGGIITKVLAPDQDGKLENVVISYRNYEDYLTNPNYFGALIGRVAGRIQNSSFTLDGVTYHLPSNEGEHHLHGGPEGFHNRLWQAEPFETKETVGVTLKHFSPDGHSGYPGNLDVTITYTLDNLNTLSVEYEGISDKNTALTLTNHSYFNLSGDLKTDIINHQLTLPSSTFVELDEESIPTGRKLNVDQTVFDFRNGRSFNEGIHSDNEQIERVGNGYDHYFIFDNGKDEKVILDEPQSGRRMTITTDQPGTIVYSSNKLGDDLALRERTSAKYLGLCLETQSSPASLHHEGFPSCLLAKNEKYYSKTSFHFGTV